MADDCQFTLLIRELIHEETSQMMDELKPLIRKMIAEEFDRRLQKPERECILDMTPNPIPPDVREATLSQLPGSKDPGTPYPIPVSKKKSTPPKDSQDESEGLYIYGIIDAPVDIRLGEIGIDNATIYTIPYRDISAIVHTCPAKPYQSEDADIVSEWIASHQSVLDTVTERFGSVLPFGFDTIMTSSGTKTSHEVFQNWIAEEYDRLRNKLSTIHGKKEYGVQIFYHPSVMSEKVLTGSDIISSLKKEMETKGPGVAYMYRKKIEQAVEQEMSVLVDAEFTTLYGQIRDVSDDTRVEKVKRTKEKDDVMMMNISCLVADEHYPVLGDVLEKIDTMKEYSVRFTGPWPPYSFV